MRELHVALDWSLPSQGVVFQPHTRHHHSLDRVSVYNDPRACINSIPVIQKLEDNPLLQQDIGSSPYISKCSCNIQAVPICYPVCEVHRREAGKVIPHNVRSLLSCGRTRHVLTSHTERDLSRPWGRPIAPRQRHTCQAFSTPCSVQAELR